MEPAITIRRQVLEVAAEGTEADGLRLQRRLTELSAEVIAPALEAGLLQVDRPDVQLAVERMELVLGEVDPDHLEAQLAEAVRAAVAGFFRAHPVPSLPGSTGTPADVASGPLTVRSVAASLDEVLVHFLRTGRLPWSFRRQPGRSLEEVLTDAWHGVTPPPATLAHLTAALATETARRRLVNQFSPVFVVGVVAAWAPAVAATLGAVSNVLAGVPRRTASLDGALHLAAVTAAGTGRAPTAHELVLATWASAGASLRADSVVARVLEEHWPGSTPTVATSTPASPRTATAPERDAGAPGASSAEDDAVLVPNAGVVLLHPFLPRFFERLGVADGDALLDPERALCLLHLLATGDRHAPEYDLVLAKLLCGVAPDEPVAADAGLGEAEVTETEALLEAVVGHWEALGGASPAALRGEFLTRPGLLTTDLDGSPLLKVEARTSDILLDRLPWALSMLQLPWMGSLLRVEWR